MPALRAVAAAHTVLTVVTQPDRPAGRGRKLSSTPVHVAARELGLEVRTPLRLRDEVESLRGLVPAVFVVASYGRILPQALLDVPLLGALNIHPSRLPLYRGADPVSAPIRDGRAETALSIMLMDAGMDTGDLVLQKTVPLAGETPGHPGGPGGIGTPPEPGVTGDVMHDRLATLGAEELLAVLAAFAAGAPPARTPQAGLAPAAEIAATLTRPLKPDDLLIDWRWDSRRIAAWTRAYSPKPAVRAELGGERVKLLDCRSGGYLGDAFGRGEPGTVLADAGDFAAVACGDGDDVVLVRTLVPAGRNPQSGAEFARRLKTELI